MATEADAVLARRDAALAVFTTGIVGNPLATQMAWTLIAHVAGATPPAPTVGEDSIEELRAFAADHRVRRLVGRFVPAGSDGAVQILKHALAMESRMVETFETLRRAGVDVLVLKGNATAHLDHFDPTDREVSDIDLLVHPDQLDAAFAAFDAVGVHKLISHPFSVPQFFHSETFVHPDGTQIDLHHRLLQPSRPPVTCWRRPDTFDIGGHQLAALPRAWRFVHALLHQLKDTAPAHRSLSGLLDLVLLWTAGVDLDAVRAAGREVGTPALTERGLARLADLLELSPMDPLAGAGRTRWAERRLAAALDSEQPTPGLVSLAANLVVQPPRRWPRFATELVWPTRDFREAQGITFGSQLRHVVREVTGR